MHLLYNNSPPTIKSGMITAQKAPKYIRLRCFRTEYVGLTTARVQFPLDSLPSLTPIKLKVQWAEIFFLFGLDESNFFNYAKSCQSQGGKGFERFFTIQFWSALD